jgi:hypothetical protein
VTSATLRKLSLSNAAEGIFRRCILIAALCTGCFRYTPHFYAPLLAEGPLTNVGRGNDAADTNAAAHVGWALAIPLAGNACYGRKGLWAGSAAWVTYSLVSELWFHAPDGAGPSYAPEFRADLFTRLGPTLGLLALDLILSPH